MEKIMEGKLLEFRDRLYTTIKRKPVTLEVIKVDEKWAYIQNIKDEHPRGVFQVFRTLEKFDQKWITQLNLDSDDWMFKNPLHGIIEFLAVETEKKYQYYLVDQEIDSLLDKLLYLSKQNSNVQNTDFFLTVLQKFISDIKETGMLKAYYGQKITEGLDHSEFLPELQAVAEKMEDIIKTMEDISGN